MGISCRPLYRVEFSYGQLMADKTTRKISKKNRGSSSRKSPAKKGIVSRRRKTVSKQKTVKQPTKKQASTKDIPKTMITRARNNILNSHKDISQVSLLVQKLRVKIEVLVNNQLKTRYLKIEQFKLYKAKDWKEFSSKKIVTSNERPPPGKKS